MKLRTAQPTDAPALAAISIEVWVGTYLRKGVSAFFAEYALNEFTTAKFAALLGNSGEHVIVSENEDSIDGFIRLTQRENVPFSACSNTEISTLYVQPRHHGRGIGNALLEQGLICAGSLGSPSVWLTANSENAPAIAFYLKHGFEKIGTTHFR